MTEKIIQIAFGKPANMPAIDSQEMSLYAVTSNGRILVLEYNDEDNKKWAEVDIPPLP